MKNTILYVFIILLLVIVACTKTPKILNYFSNYIQIKAQTSRINSTSAEIIIQYTNSENNIDLSSINYTGICYNILPFPTINNLYVGNFGTSKSLFNVKINDLAPNTNYYFRPFFQTYNRHIEYGNEISLKTLSVPIPTFTIPTNSSIIRCCKLNFSWNKISEANSYDLQISNSSSFQSSVNYIYDNCDGSDYYYPIKNRNNILNTYSTAVCINSGRTQSNGIWYARIKANINSYSSAWSPTVVYTYTN